MKYCPQCGTENRPNARFCTNCSCSLLTERRCHQCGAANNLTANFCHQCATHLKTAPFQKRQGATGRLPPKHLLADRYMILKVLGRGGMGAVYLADDTRLRGKQWAIKEMSDELLNTDEQLQQGIAAFEQEAMLLSNLSHPNLPNVVDYFDEGNKHYLVMDYIDGQTLADIVTQQNSPIDEADILDWAEQLCDVLDYLHTQPKPIIFRDLKPDNIMLTPDKQIKLIDFGIVRFFKQGKSADTSSLGTAGFAPPEQYGSGQTDARSDIYALGATLHYLLTLRAPHEDPFNFPRITKFNPMIANSTEDAIMKAVARQPANRWRTIKEMRAALNPPVSSTFGAFPPTQNAPPNLPHFAPTVAKQNIDPTVLLPNEKAGMQSAETFSPVTPTYDRHKLPSDARGLCWGGFLLTGFWGFGNGMWYLIIVTTVLSFIPIIGQLLNLVLGLAVLFKGREWSWQNRQWDSVEQFNRAQRNWTIAGLILIGLLICIWTVAFMSY